MKIHCFIFNWKNQYRKTKYKENQLNNIKNLKITVINSDESVNSIEPNWINIGEEAYFTAQFLKAIDLFNEDIFFHIQGDASYFLWENLINDALKYHEKYNWGIYAPNVDYTWYDSSRTDINSIKFTDNNLKMVGCTDCTCWFINSSIIQNYKSSKILMNDYKMGWGWDILFPAISFLNGNPVIRDYHHTIHHPRGTNYNVLQAEQEMLNLFNSLPNELKTVFSYIRGNRDTLSTFFRS
jgi:hypothetical protein